FAFEIFEDEKVDAVLPADVVKGADVGMVQAGYRAGLAFQALAKLGMLGELRGQDFNGDDAVQTRIAGFIDLAHAACAEGVEDLVRPEFCAAIQDSYCRVGFSLRETFSPAGGSQTATYGQAEAPAPPWLHQHSQGLVQVGGAGAFACPNLP